MYIAITLQLQATATEGGPALGSGRRRGTSGSTATDPPWASRVNQSEAHPVRQHSGVLCRAGSGRITAGHRLVMSCRLASGPPALGSALAYLEKA